MSAQEPALAAPPIPRSPVPSAPRARRLDISLLAGIVIAAGAVIAGILSTGVGLLYFLQPTGALIVLGGTLGVVLITTPRYALLHCGRRVVELFAIRKIDREALIEEIVAYARASRRDGLLALEESAPKASDGFLRDALLLALDVKERVELASALETKLRMRERQGETDAKTLEVAAGYAPTLGILGTVVALIHVLRQFSNLDSIGFGIGAAFVSTMYGLGFANLFLLPASHRIRARVVENFEIQELITEGVLCIFDQMHPSLIRRRLNAFLRPSDRLEQADGKAAAHSSYGASLSRRA